MQLPPIFPNLPIATIAWISLFYIHRAGSFDPHNPQAIAGRTKCAIKASVILLATVGTAYTTPTEVGRDFATFLGMFALAHTVAVPFVSPGRYTKAEVPNSFERYVLGYKTSIAGGLILKVAAVVLALILPDAWGLYGAITPVIVVGACLLCGKVFLGAVLRAQREIQTGQDQSHSGSPNTIYAFIAYAWGSNFVVYLLHQNEVTVDATSWMGWSGFLLGTVLAGTR